MTDSARFQRGQGYYQSGAVTGLRQYRGKVSATVAGSQDYRVNLWEEDGELEYECDCPDGMDYEFCKHCVAVGLALLDDAGSKNAGSKSSRKNARKEITAEDIHGWLEQQDVAMLADLLMAQAMDAQNLYRKLQLKVAGILAETPISQLSSRRSGRQYFPAISLITTMLTTTPEQSKPLSMP